MSLVRKIIWLPLVILLFGLVSCGGSQTSDPSEAITQVWRTVAVAQTQTALNTSPTPSETPPAPETPTPQITNTLPTVATNITATRTATRFFLSTSTPFLSMGTPCDNANFVKDVNYPDFSKFEPGNEFIKTWAFNNLGPCTWETNYHLVFSYVSDTGKDGVFTPPAPVDFPYKVLPGESMEISVTLKAPTKPGTYEVVFVLKNDKGYLIPLKNMGTYEFWAIFVVVEP